MDKRKRKKEKRKKKNPPKSQLLNSKVQSSIPGVDTSISKSFPFPFSFFFLFFPTLGGDIRKGISDTPRCSSTPSIIHGISSSITPASAPPLLLGSFFLLSVLFSLVLFSFFFGFFFGLFADLSSYLLRSCLSPPPPPPSPLQWLMISPPLRSSP